jgi:molecular chaperone GrpE
MSKKERKIVTPSEEEVAQYGGQQPSEEGNSSEAQEEAASGEVENSSESADVEAADENWKEKALRAKAELLNYQRRTQKDREESMRYAYAGLVRSLLPVIDDLERVITSAEEHTQDAQSIIDGVKMTLENFYKVLREFHVHTIESEGQPFDPQFHEAMMEQPSDEYPPRTVLQEVVKGYKLHDRVIRPAKVIVSKAAEGSTDAGESSES